MEGHLGPLAEPSLDQRGLLGKGITVVAGGMSMRIGGPEVFLLFIVWLIPALVIGWLLYLANRAVRALESISESLRHNKVN